MAKFTITGEGSTIGKLERGREYTGLNSDNMLKWLMKNYGANAAGEPRTPTEAFNAWADDVFNSFEATVTREMRNDAAKKAAEEITAIKGAIAVK